MCMSNLYVVEFDNGDKMTGSISQVYAAQEVNGCAVTLHPYIEVRKAPAPIAQDDGTMTGYALFVPALPYTGEWRQITGTYQRMLDAFNARNKLLEFDEVEYCVKYSCRGCFICWSFCSCWLLRLSLA
nr:MAG TPA: hypothetical protein [Caudoviricetes sp.]